MSTTTRGGWGGGDDLPVAERVAISATSRDDEPLLIVELRDAAGDARRFALPPDAGWVLLHGLVSFLHLASK